MQSVKEASVEWIRRHVVELWPHEQQPGEVAEALSTIAAEQGVPVEAVIEWLHEQHAAGEDLSSAHLADLWFSRASATEVSSEEARQG